MRKIIWLLFSIGLWGSYLPNNRPFGINLTYGDIAYFLCAALILMISIKKRDKHKMSFKINQGLLLGIFFLTLGCLLSFMRSTNIVESLATLIQYLFIFSILLYVIKYLLEVNTYTNTLKLLAITIFPHLIIEFLNLLSYLKVVTIFDSTLISGNGRYVGFYGNANALGINTISALIFLVLFFMHTKNNLTKLVFVLLIIIALFSIGLSASFGSILLLFLMSVFIFLFMNTKVKLRILYLFALIFLVTGIGVVNSNSPTMASPFLPEKLAERLIHAESDGLGSSSLRLSLNKEGISHFFDNPLVGLGFSEFPKISIYNQTVHNTIIITAAETGVFGLIGILILIISPIILAYQLTKYVNLKLRLIILFLYFYAVFRLISTITSGHFISREPWIPVLSVFVIYHLVVDSKRKEKPQLPFESF